MLWAEDSQNSLDRESIANEIDPEDIAEDTLDDLVESLPLQGFTDEGFLVIEETNLVDWSRNVIEEGFVLGAADRIAHYEPRLEGKDDIIDEKDEVILNLNERLVYYREQTTDLRVALSTSERNNDRLRIERDNAEKARDEETDRANTWRTRFWISTGVGVGVVGALTYIIAN